MARKVNYLSNKNLLAELELCMQAGKMTDKFANMMMMLVNRYAGRPNYSGYSYIDDMKAQSLHDVCRVWNRFDPERSNNPFAYFTQIIKHSFYQTLNKEKKVRLIRDRELMYAGLDSSFDFMENYEHESK